MTTAARHPRQLLFAVAIIGLLAAFALTSVQSAQGGLIRTQKAYGCDEPSQVFAPWGDYAWYGLVPGGTFEDGEPEWSMAGDTSIVDGNEPFYVNGESDRRSLELRAGGSALSPTVCFGFGDWHARFFVRNVGSRLGSLKVDVVVRSVLGVASLLDGGSISGGGEWAPSPRVRLTVTNLCSLFGVRSIAFRFRAVGPGAAFQVDDVYLDPWKDY